MNKSSYSFLKFVALILVSFGWSSANAQPPAPYCATSYSNQCNTGDKPYIKSFSTTGGVTNITNNNTNCGNTVNSYSDYTNMVASQNAGSTINLLVTFESNSTYLLKSVVAIDFNQDNVFDASETFDMGIFNPSIPTKTQPIPIPALAKDGNTRMRVRMVSNGSGTPIADADICGSGTNNPILYGETEDYTINIINPCLPPDVLSIANVDYNSAEVSWSEKGNARMYEYTYSADPNYYPNSIGYNFTNQRFLSLNNLICDTTYYVFVRCICDTTGSSIFWDTSSWKVDSFKTDPCCYDPKPTMTNITSTTAIGRWAPIGSAYGYEYAVSVKPTPPQNGTYTTYTSVYLQGLMSSQLYYLHVRSRCSPTPLSEWNSRVFQTSKSLDVNAVNGSNFFEMTAFPNPVSDNVSVTVNGTRAGQGMLYLTDLTGKTLNTMPVTSEITNVDMSYYPSGVYIIKYIDDEHNKVLKVNKQ